MERRKPFGFLFCLGVMLNLSHSFLVTSLPDQILHTVIGDIHETVSRRMSKNCELYDTHCHNRYYDNLIFDRDIKGFHDTERNPLGDGPDVTSGRGQSIWGREFEDEFHKSLRHDRPFTVSMANGGPNTINTQFLAKL